MPTRFISNDRGHLAKAQNHKPGQNPFGNFHGTWDEPCHHPGNHVENTVCRSSVGAAILEQAKKTYNAKVKELESKHDNLSENQVCKIFFLIYDAFSPQWYFLILEKADGWHSLEPDYREAERWAFCQIYLPEFRRRRQLNSSISNMILQPWRVSLDKINHIDGYQNKPHWIITV